LETGIVHFGFLGHKSLAFSDDRWKGFHTGLARYGYKAARYDLDPSEAHLRPWTIGEVQDSLKSWIRELPKPFALFCDNDERALTALEICEELDIDVPNQMAILGVDYDPYLAALSYPPLSSIVIPARRVGYEAALLLNRLMAGAKPPTQAILKEPIGVIKNRSTDVLAIPDPLLRKAIHFIRDHAADDLRIDDVADHAQVSRRKLETLFRKHLDRSPLEEVRSVRIRIAQNLLATTDFTLETIAEKTGFGTANWLSANFSKVCGISPGRYRRKIQGHSDQDSID
jgi:LacI family transcriptional regulator